MGVAVALFAADQWLKRYVDAHLPLIRRYPILFQDWLVLSRFHNRGVLGNRLSNIPADYVAPYTRYLPAVAFALLLGVALARLRQRKDRWAFPLLLAGGASNLWDHWRQEYVVDTLQLGIGGGVYLPFNFADAAIVAGGVATLMSLVKDLIGERQADSPSLISSRSAGH